MESTQETRPEWGQVCRSAIWLYTHKLKAELIYVCPNTECHPCLRQKGNQSQCGEYPPCPFSPSSTPESILLMSHQRWKKYSKWRIPRSHSLYPLVIQDAAHVPSPRRFLLNRKSSSCLLLQESLLFLLGKVKQKDHPQTSRPY